MTEKRFIIDEDYNWVDTVTGEWIREEDAFDIMNALAEENEQLKQFPIKLETRIQKLHEDLNKLIEMDKTGLNPQSVEDVATVISISLNALTEFKKELSE